MCVILFWFAHIICSIDYLMLVAVEIDFSVTDFKGV